MAARFHKLTNDAASDQDHNPCTPLCVDTWIRPPSPQLCSHGKFLAHMYHLVVSGGDHLHVFFQDDNPLLGVSYDTSNQILQ